MGRRTQQQAMVGSVQGSVVSEKGTLQMLFDVRLMLDVLAGQAPVATVAPKSVALMEALQEKLDPIDWATYEPYLWVNEERYYQRCAVLLGALVQLSRVHAGAPGRLPQHAETNTLNKAAPVGRFPYLPISAPTAPHADSEGAGGATSAAGTTSTAGLVDLPGMDGSLDSGLGALKGLGSGFMGKMGSKFGGVAGSFQSLGAVLGDGKLQDKSAEAMASFGNMFGAAGVPLTNWGASRRES